MSADADLSAALIEIDLAKRRLGVNARLTLLDGVRARMQECELLRAQRDALLHVLDGLVAEMLSVEDAREVAERVKESL